MEGILGMPFLNNYGCSVVCNSSTLHIQGNVLRCMDKYERIIVEDVKQDVWGLVTTSELPALGKTPWRKIKSASQGRRSIAGSGSQRDRLCPSPSSFAPRLGGDRICTPPPPLCVKRRLDRPLDKKSSKSKAPSITMIPGSRLGTMDEPEHEPEPQRGPQAPRPPDPWAH